MPNDCLAITGGAGLTWVIGGFVLLIAGFALIRINRVVKTCVVAVLLLVGLSTSDAIHREAGALCSPASSSILQGSLRVIGGTIQANELPVVTATDGSSTITALWGSPESAGPDVVVAFAFPHLTPGIWTIELTESPLTSFEFASSTESFVVNSSRMLTGGPFNLTTVSPLTVTPSGLSVEISVTRS